MCDSLWSTPIQTLSVPKKKTKKMHQPEPRQNTPPDIYRLQKSHFSMSIRSLDNVFIFCWSPLKKWVEKQEAYVDSTAHPNEELKTFVQNRSENSKTTDSMCFVFTTGLNYAFLTCETHSTVTLQISGVVLYWYSQWSMVLPKLRRHLNAKNTLSDHDSIHRHRHLNYTECYAIALHWILTHWKCVKL